MRSMAKCDAWSQTLNLLVQISSDNVDGGHLGDADESADNFAPIRRRSARPIEYEKIRPAFISVLERYSPSMVSISWRDATYGRYGDQLWRLGVARSKSICDLSGATIRRGDRVYRPSLRGLSPKNATHAILAEALERLEHGSQISTHSGNDALASDEAMS